MQRKSPDNSSYKFVLKELARPETIQEFLEESNQSCHKRFLQNAYLSLKDVFRIEDIDLNKIETYTSLPWRDKSHLIVEDDMHNQNLPEPQYIVSKTLPKFK